jgi:hypothetical protein
MPPPPPPSPAHMFYLRHRDELVPVPIGQRFYGNSESSYVSIKEEPGSENEVAILDNNEVFNIRYSYNHEGELWGLVERVNRYRSISGWIPMNQLLLIEWQPEEQSIQHAEAGAPNSEPSMPLIPSSQVQSTQTDSQYGMPLLVISLVAVLVVSTAVLIWVFWRRNK